MKRILSLIVCIVFVSILGACGENSNDEHANHMSSNGGSDMEEEQTIEPLQVDLQIPDTINPNQATKIQAFVTVGNEKVDDANEVMFEIWKEGAKEESEMLEGTSDGEGVYSVEETFEAEGTYFVVSHVTARDMHNMPKKEVTVGESNSKAK